MKQEDFKERLNGYVNAVTAALDGYIPDVDPRSGMLRDAMSYSLRAGGKRLRPALMLACADISGGDVQEAMPYACAMEFIHTYSLIHDDHPSLDNDDLRRGKPTNHRMFGDGTAILAGDGLLNSAFDIMLDDIINTMKKSGGNDPEGSGLSRRILAAGEISAAAGVKGMIAGQMTDLMMTADSQPGSIDTEKAAACLKKAGGSDEDILKYIHANKTGAMIRGAVRAGAILGGCAPDRLTDFTEYGEKIGIVFQIVDDILDVTGDEAVIGKKTGMDEAMGKLSYPSVYGLKSSYAIAEQMTAEAVEAGRRAAGEDTEGGMFLKSIAIDLASRLS